MKAIKLSLSLALALAAISASAQSINANANVNVKALNAEVKANATTSKGNEVSAAAGEVRSMNETEKKTFLTTVKTHAELQSKQDLDNFAKGVMIKDENVSAVEADDSNVEVHYKLPAKFLGIFSTGLDAIANVSFESEKTGRGPKEVTVKFPWYRLFFSLSTSTRAEVLQAAIDKSVQVNAQTPRDNAYAQNGVTVQLISSILKGIRAEIETKAEVK
jgi:hypothetical protein